MGLFTTKLEEELQKLTVEQLRAFAAENEIDIEPRRAGFMDKLATGGAQGKAYMVQKLVLADLKVEAVHEFSKRWLSQREGDVKKEAEPVAVASTPTLAPSRSNIRVSFDDLVAYLDDYRFISRYTDEQSYEIELAGALRERFGTVIRQFPVPNSTVDADATRGAQRPRVIDLDVAGIGIEIKFQIRGDKNWLALTDQLARYKTHYGERLILMLIAIDANDDSRIHDYTGLAHVLRPK